MSTNIRKTILAISSLAFLMAGCTPANQTTSPTTVASLTPTASPMPAPTATSTLIPTLAYTPLPESDGPTLLLQTDFHTYQIIDFGLGTTYTFFPPEDDVEYTLKPNVSPDRSQLILINESKDIRIVDLATGDIRAVYQIDPDSLQLEETINTVQEILPELGYTDDMLENSLESAYLESRQNISWFRDDDHLLSVQSGSGAGTHLTLVDLQTDETTPLENEPGFVQAVYIGSNDNYILLKKSYLFGANIWEDDRYYLVDLSNNAVTPIPLPEDLDNPSLSWFDQDHIRIIHQTDIAGSENYSILNINTLESTVLFTGLFTNIWKFGDGILVLTKDQTNEETIVESVSMEAESLASETLDGSCVRTFIVGDNLLINCETESILLDEDLSPQHFSDPISILNSSSNGVVIITKSNEYFLYDASLEYFQSLELVGEPLEVLWLPAASGFLYRTYGMVYHYDFLTRSSSLLLESDLFTDYRNLNAVWINLN